MTDRDAWQAVYDWMMFTARPAFGGSRFAAPEQAFPAVVMDAVIHLNATYKPTSFGQRLTGQETLPDGSVRDVPQER